METKKISSRIHYMDNLRAYAMLLGIIFHASLAYSPLMHEVWISADSQNSMIIDVFAWLSHLFRMPLFFLVAGFFGFYLLEKRGVKGFLRNRGLRIGLPFVIFLPILTIFVFAGVGYALGNIDAKSPMLQIIAYASQNADANSSPPLTTMHLWFLFYLLIFYVIGLGVYILKINEIISRFMQKFPLVFIGVFVLFLVPCFAMKVYPHPAPESFIPELWAIGLYGAFFMLGFVLYQNEEFLDKIQKYTAPMFVIGLVAYAGFYTMIPKGQTLEEGMEAMQNVTLSNTQILAGILQAIVASCMTISILLIGRQFFNFENRFIRYFTDSSYWLYLIHLPILFFVQFLLLDMDLGMWMEFSLSTIITIAFGISTYGLFVRWTFIGTLLNGKRKPIF